MNDIDIFMNAPEGASAEELAAYLDEACAGDAALRGRVEALFAADQATLAIADHPPKMDGAGGPASTPASESEGSVIGPYKLLQKIGEGGFGTVFMAEQTKPVKRRVALKIIKQGMDTRQVIARFEAERQALAMMEHQNIAKVLDAGATETGRPYFVMELVRGVPITTFCDEQGLDNGRRLELFQDVCAAVGHAHQKGIIHRDLKPSNILVGLDGDTPIVKVIDFGVAKATQMQLTDKTLFTRFEQFIGTPLYISPEQASLSPIDIDTRSDIYSLGVLLYELLTGKPPIDKEELLKAGFDEMRRLIREQEPPKPSTRLSTATDDELRTIAKARHTEPRKLGLFIKGDLDWIVLKALEKDRQRRYETTNALRQDINRFLNDEVVTATPPSAAYKFRKFARRKRGVLAAASTLLLVLVAGSIVSSSQWFRAEGEAAEARTARAESEERARQLKEQTRELEAARNRGQKRLAVLARADQTTARTLLKEGKKRDANAHLARACENNPTAEGGYLESVLALNRWHSDSLASSMGAIGLARGGSFSPDGERCVVIGLSNVGDSGGSSQAWVLESASGRVLDSHQPGGDEEEVGAARFEPNGNLILLVWNRNLKESPARIWDVGTGAFRCTLSEELEFARPTFFSPDGGRLLTGIHRGASSCALWDTASGERIAELPGEHPERFLKNGARLLTTSSDSGQTQVRVRDASSGDLLHELRLEKRSEFLSMDEGGEWVVIASQTEAGDREASVHEMEGGDRLRGLDRWYRGPGDRNPQHMSGIVGMSGGRPVTSMLRGKKATFSPDGARLVAGRGKQARVWDAKSGLLLATLAGHTGRVEGVCFSPDGMLIATYSPDGFIGIWRTSNGDNVRMVKLTDGGVTGELEFSPDGRRLLAAGKFIFELSGRELMTAMKWSARSAVSPDGTRLATIDPEGVVRIEEAGTGLLLAKWSGESALDMMPMRHASYSGDGTRIATTHTDGVARVWDSESETLLVEIPGKAEEIRDGFALLDHDGRRALVRRIDGVELWDVDHGRLIRTLKGAHHASFHPDGSLIASAETDGQKLHISEAESGRILISVEGRCLARFGPNGGKVITNDLGSFGIKVIDSGSGTVLRTVGLTHEHAAIPGPGGLVCLKGKGLEVYGPTGRLLAQAEPMGNPLRISLDGKRLFTSDDSTLNLIQLSPLLDPVPEWWPRFLESMAHRRFNEDGIMEQLSIDTLVALHEQVASGAYADRTRAGELARWFLAGAGERPILPGHALTERAMADQLITVEAAEDDLWKAYLFDPTHPLIHLAMSRFEEKPEQAERLLRHSLDRLPDDPQLKDRAAELQSLPEAKPTP